MTAVPLPAVPGNQIWCSHLAAYNINRYFQPPLLKANRINSLKPKIADKQNSEKDSDFIQKYFLVSSENSKQTGHSVPGSPAPELATCCQILVFKTPEVKELDADILGGLIGTYIKDTPAYFTHGQISR